MAINKEKPNLQNYTNYIDLYADVKNLSEIEFYRNLNYIKGFTTNPTLVRKGGNTHYLSFIESAIELIGNSTISIEVIADEFHQMLKQAKLLNSISKKIFVKIPIYNTKHESSIPLVLNLLELKCPINITAVMTIEQINNIAEIIDLNSNLIISIFAGRIADTGIDPVPIINHAVSLFKNYPKIKVLWASPREILNIQQAIDCKCDIITMIPDLLNKLNLIGRDLDSYSLETVKTFFNDALESNYSL